MVNKVVVWKLMTFLQFDYANQMNDGKIKMIRQLKWVSCFRGMEMKMEMEKRKTKYKIENGKSDPDQLLKSK